MVADGGVLHGVPMPKGCLRVSVDEVVDGSALLPFRISDDMDTVESALATHVAWPANLVVERSVQVKVNCKAACLFIFIFTFIKTEYHTNL